MSSGRFQKGFRFKLSDKEWIEKLLEMRDKIKYPTVGDYATQIFRTFNESNLVYDDDMDLELKKICVAEELILAGDYFVCSRGGTCSNHKQYLKRKDPHVFKIAKEAMSLNTVKKICRKCYISSVKYRRYINSEEYKRSRRY